MAIQNHKAAPILSAAVFFLVTMLSICAPVAADEGGTWTIVESAGNVHVTQNGIRPVALSSGDEIGAGQRIVTDGDGRAVLRRGKNTIVVSPNSVMEVPGDGKDGMMTRIRHVIGTLLFDVEKRKEQHFEVLTPDVAVVVKGTTFTTSVGAQGAVVHVISGLVQVADIRSGQSVFVRPGQTAVSPQGGGRVGIQDTPAASPSPATDRGVGDQASSGSQGNGDVGKGRGKAKGVRIAHAITGETTSLGQISNGLLRRDGGPQKGGLGGNPFDNAQNGPTNPGGNTPKGLAHGLSSVIGGTPGNSAFGHSQGGGANPGNSSFGQGQGGGSNPGNSGGNPGNGGGNPGNSGFGHSQGGGKN
ncbi:MAG TPA: hypothetical protein DCG48_00610 [Rhodospirillaceae bacterium]|nr:hypothetical protein [Rhodospirillaceae bacterium]|tara:strand:- start:1429 stop:2502 length:1074 start_codon:yes stop_codon:yes gene_type:complete